MHNKFNIEKSICQAENKLPLQKLQREFTFFALYFLYNSSNFL